MADNVGVTPSAPVTGSAGPVSTPSTPGSAPMAPEDIFSDLEKQLGLDAESEEKMNLAEAKKYKDGTEEDLVSLGNEEEGNESQTEEAATTNDTTQDETTDTSQNTATDFPSLEFKGKVGEKDYAFKIKDQAHLDKIVKRAIVAEDLYRQSQNYQKIESEYKELREYHNNFDKLVDENPEEVLTMIAEEMNEDTLKQWIVKMADEIAKDPQQKALEKRLRHAEMLERRMQELEEREKSLRERRKQAAEEADKRAIQTWHEGWKQKLSGRIPEKYLDLASDKLYDARREAKERQDRGETITLKTLDAIFTRKLKPILELINGNSAVQDRVKTEVGRTLDAKKQQNLTRIQNAVSSQNRPLQSKTRMQRAAENSDVFSMFDEIERGVGSGSIRIREG